jgi:O-antigen ligase
MESLIAIGAVAGLLWATFILQRGGLVAGCLLVLLSGSCFGYYFFNVPTGAIPLTSDRLLLAVVVVQYVVYRRFALADPKPLRTPEWILLAFIGTLFVSTFMHDWNFKNAQPVSRLTFYYLMPVALYWVARQSPITERASLWIFGGLAGFGVYLGLTGVAETRQLWSVVFPSYIGSPEYGEFYGRGRGPFLNPIAMGINLSICLVAALMWWPRVRESGRLGILLVAGVCCAGLYCTLTRSVWMGTALALAIVVGLSVPRTTRVVLLATGMLVGTAFVATSWESLLAFKRDKDVSAEDVADSARLRPILATVAWHMFLDRPLFGFGFGQYEREKNAYLSDRSTELPLEKARPYVQHNAFLSILTDTGAIGLGLFVVLLCLWTRDAWRLWQANTAPLWARQQGLLFLGAMGAYLPNAFFHDVSIAAMVNMFLFFLAGVTSGLVERTTGATAHPSYENGHAAWGRAVSAGPIA